MEKQKLLTTEEIQEILSETWETLFHSDPDPAVSLLEQAEKNYPGIDWNSPAGELLFRNTLTPLALKYKELLLRNRMRSTKT